MEKLPTELLGEIFSHLRGPDRLSAGLVCQRWAEIVSASRFLRDICLVLRVANLQRVTPILLHSHRQYTNLKICDGTLYDFHQEFWARIAGDLVTLQLENCHLSAGVLYAILGECQKLQSLHVTDLGRVGQSGGFKYPKELFVAKVQQSLRDVRHLSLPNNGDLSDASFNQLLTLMPNITSLCLAGCSNLRFRPRRSDTISSSDVLTFQNVLVCMMRSKQEFVELDFSHTLIDDEALIQIVGLYRESLTSLRLDRCDQLAAEAYEAIGECSRLRLLSLHETSQTNDENLECILTKTPDLEYLDLGFCRQISSRSLGLVVQLQKLRHLNLNCCKRISIDSLGSLAALTELQHLNLSNTECDVEAFRQLASLKDLRSLEMRDCSNLDSECFAIICNSFKRLEKLNLESSIDLSDDAGCEFHRLKYLRSLNITVAEGISPRSLENGIGAPDMKSLSIGWNPWLTDSALFSIANHHGCLEYLDLDNCQGITDVGLISTMQCLPRLRTLTLRENRSLTDRSLQALQYLCPHLRKLDVTNGSMSDDALDLLAHLRPSLSIIGWERSQYSPEGSV